MIGTLTLTPFSTVVSEGGDRSQYWWFQHKFSEGAPNRVLKELLDCKRGWKGIRRLNSISVNLSFNPRPQFFRTLKFCISYLFNVDPRDNPYPPIYILYDILCTVYTPKPRHVILCVFVFRNIGWFSDLFNTKIKNIFPSFFFYSFSIYSI